MTSPDLMPELQDSPIDNEMAQVEQCIYEQLNVEQEIIRLVSEHLIGGGGKRTRPLLCLLTAHAINPADSAERRVKLAVAIELIHTATLLHDDVVDQSSLRRGHATANLVWSDEACILIGDYLYSRAFQLITSLDNSEIASSLATTTNTIASGEVSQYINKSNNEIDEATYMTVIQEKTAVLFEASCYTGALLCDATNKVATDMASYGRHLGIAFQLIDDVLDYSETRSKKMAGDDLADGKLTLPAIHAMANADATDAAYLRTAFEKKSRDSLSAITAILKKTNSLQYTRDRAIAHVEKAVSFLRQLPDSLYRESLMQLARRTISREV